jgi:Glyoxalase-like domain
MVASWGVSAKFKDICLDANDNGRIADWWCAALGYARRDPTVDSPEPICIVDPDGEGPPIWVNTVPERKQVKNRVHIDVFGNVDELIALGATLVRPEDEDIDWTILADPEGNEFCVFVERD